MRHDDEAVARRVLEHIERRTTDKGAEVWREPVANYRSEARFAAEVTRVLRRIPVPFCPSGAIPNPGDYLAREAAGIPLVAVRGTDGRARVFRNACRHRGTQVASGAGCAKTFVCPYHAWTYELDGRLRHIPHEEGFPGIDKREHGLVPVRAEERHGLVFASEDPPLAGAAAPDPLPELIGPGQRVFATAQAELEVNWKILLEGFIEGYHIRFTHPETFYPYGFDNLNLIDFYGRSSRVTYPFRRIDKLKNVPPAQRRVEGLLTFAYHVFPNVMVIGLSRHTTVVVLEPLAVNRTRSCTWSIANGTTDEDLEEARRDADFVGNTGLAEDRAVALSIQRGLASGANEHFTFGHYESAIVHFHRTLAELLA